MSLVSSTQTKAPAVPAELARKPLNRAKAIREFCIECMNYQVQLVNKCPDLACPLWEWRRGPGAPEPSEVPIRRQQHRQRPCPSHGLAPRRKDGDHGATA